MRRSKIVCTLGPATSSDEQIGALIDAGMDVARLNFSHGDHDFHRKTLDTLRRKSAERNRPIAVLQDIQGPKIRVNRFEGGQAELIAGRTFTITTDNDVVGNSERVSTTYMAFPDDVQVGDRVLLDDGLLALTITEVSGREVITTVNTGGILKDRKGINLPGVAVSAPCLTEKDRKDMAFGMRYGVDYIALSFVRSADDIRQARELATAGAVRIPLIAKIEKPEAIADLDEIIEEADGIMIARGDLGVELGPEKVPLIQKDIIEKTNARGKIVITATQMLESMIENKRPTRAEASDVANAVLDGTDAVMLSGETAVGKYPLEVVRTMSRIIREVESSQVYKHNQRHNELELPVMANAIAKGAVSASRQLDLKAIAVVTNSGGAARLISEYRPEAPIAAMTCDEITYRRLALYWGVIPMLITPAMTTDEMVRRVEDALLSAHIATSGDPVAITMATPVGAGGTTNMLTIHKLP